MRPSISIAVAGLLCLNGGAVAQPKDTSANSVFPGCKAYAGGLAINAQSPLTHAANYCSGVVHGLAYVGKIVPAEYQSCAPPTSDRRELARVVVKYIEERPQRMHEDFRKLVLEAFHNAWPCKAGQ